MKLNRRRFLKFTSCLLTSSVALIPHHSRSQSGRIVPLPNPATFESGDFIWPKKPAAYVPYHSGGSGDPAIDEIQWKEERERFLNVVDKQKTHLTDDDIRRLKKLDYREFYAIYAGDQEPEQFVAYSTGDGLYVGHVAILELDHSGVPWVIEALVGRGVVRQRYGEWVANRPGVIVWHGRLKGIEAKQRTQVVAESKKYIERPYNFWNFNLNDDTNFYCSKLVWLSVFRSLGLAVDDNSNPKRNIWFSPKQLLNAKSVVRLHNPTEY